LFGSKCGFTNLSFPTGAFLNKTPRHWASDWKASEKWPYRVAYSQGNKFLCQTTEQQRR